MINLEWAQHRSGVHQMFPSSISIKDSDGNDLVTSYALRRPDGNWALMLVNRDETTAHSIRVSFEQKGRQNAFTGPVRVTTFGSEQYQWVDNGLSSHASPDGPPAAMTVEAGEQTEFTLPKASITVLRGKVADRR
jgi:hypothetical protein